MMDYKKLIGAGFVALGIILIPLLVLPQYNLISATKEAVNARQAGISKKQALLVKITDLKNKVSERRADVDKLATVLPQTKKTQDVIVNLEEIAKETGVNLKTVKTAKIEGLKGADSKIMQIEINSSSQYKSVFDFIRLAEKNLRVLDLQEFTISLDSSSNIPGGLNFAAKIYTYFVE